MANSYEIARLLVRLAVNEEEPDFLTHLRLQKLLYYVQAWSLVQREAPMFEERIEAWANGPIVRDLYSRLAANGRGPILPEDVDAEGEIDLADDERDFVSQVWYSYKGYSASRLWEMTHEEDPWINARKGYGPADRCDVEITHEAMRAYFSAVPAE
jgi:uncharacterized phage-associated protein